MKKSFLILILSIFALSGCTSMGGMDLTKTAGPPGGPPPPPLITSSQVTSPSGDTSRVTVTPDAIYDIAVANAGAGSIEVESDIYGAGWDTDDTHAPSQNVIYDYLIQLDTDADGDVDSFDATAFEAAETDPIVGAISGIVKADGAGTIEAAVAGTDYLAIDGDGSGLSGVLLSGGTDNINDTHIDWGTGSNEVSGADVPLDVTNFNGSLSISETTVQLAFDALDDSIGAADAFTVKVDAGATAGYLGAANSDGVLRTDGTIVTYTDGGDFVTIGLHAYLNDIAGITAAQGDVLYFDGTDWVNLAPGTDGYFLKTQGAGENPVWSTPAGGGDITTVGTCQTGDCFVDGSTTSTALVFEMTDNAYETTFTAIDPTADRTISLPDATGTVLLADGTGSGLTAVDAITGDSATAFFDAGAIELNYGGLGADASAYDGLVKITGGSASDVTITAAGEAILDDASASAQRTTLGLVIGTDVLAEQTVGIANDNLLEVDGTPGDGEAAVFTANGINGLSEAEFKIAFNMEAGTDYEAVDADILRADTADTVEVNWTFGNADTDTLTLRSLLVGGNSRAVWIAGSAPSPDHATTSDDLYVGGDVEIAGNLYANGIEATQGADPGQTTIWEGSAGGTDYRGWTVPSTLAQSLRYELPDGNPSDNDFFLLGTPSGGESAVSYGSFSSEFTVSTGEVGLTSDGVDLTDISDATGTPGGGTFLRGDNTWSAVTAEAAGADDGIQYNVSDALASEAAFSYDPDTNTLNVTQNGTDPALTLGDGTYSMGHMPQLYVEGVSEFDGAGYFDGNLTVAGTLTTGTFAPPDLAGATGNNEFSISPDDDSSDTLVLRGYDVDAASWDNIVTITNANTPTLALAADGGIAITSPVTFSGAGDITLPDESVDSDQYVDGSIDLAHLSTDSVNYAKTTGSFKALTPVSGSTTGFAAGFTGANLYGGTYVVTSDTGDLQLPLMVAGMNFTIITSGDIEVVAATNANDGYMLDGVDTAEDNSIVNASTSGDIAVIQYYTADDWLITTNGWTTE